MPIYSFKLIRDWNQVFLDIDESIVIVYVSDIQIHNGIIDIHTNISLTKAEELELERIVMNDSDSAVV